MTSLDSKISQCEGILGYTFEDKMLCATAIVTSKASIWIHQKHAESFGNGRLAVLGDQVMSMALCQKWYGNTESKKGAWDAMRQGRLGNDGLAKFGFENGIDKCLVQNAGTGQTVSPKTMATAVEAIFGAICLDAGPEAVERVMVQLGFMGGL